MTAPSLLELPLDDELLKVLASDTRRDILRLLLERRMTGTELAGRLGLGKPAISEHLKKLADTELVVRNDDPERRWVYYALSTRGRSLLEPQRVRFYLVMGVAAVSMVVGVVLALGMMWLQGAIVDPSGLQPSADMEDSGSGSFGSPADVSASGLPVEEPPAGSAPSEDGPLLLEPPPVTPVEVVPKGPATAQDAVSPPMPIGPAGFALTVPTGTELPELQDPSSIMYIFTPYDVDTANGTVHVTAVTLTGVASVVPAAASSAASGTTPTVGGAPSAPDTMAAAPAQAPAGAPTVAGGPEAGVAGGSTASCLAPTDVAASNLATSEVAATEAAPTTIQAGVPPPAGTEPALPPGEASQGASLPQASPTCDLSLQGAGEAGTTDAVAGAISETGSTSANAPSPTVTDAAPGSPLAAVSESAAATADPSATQAAASTDGGQAAADPSTGPGAADGTAPAAEATEPGAPDEPAAAPDEAAAPDPEAPSATVSTPAQPAPAAAPAPPLATAPATLEAPDLATTPPASPSGTAREAGGASDPASASSATAADPAGAAGSALEPATGFAWPTWALLGIVLAALALATFGFVKARKK